MTSKITHNATSSPESVGGQLRLDLQDGEMIAPSGQEARRVSRSAARESKKAKQMNDTFSPHGSASLASVNLQRSLESKLQARLPTGGLTMFIKGWKQKVTPLGRRYCQLAVLARPIDATDCGLWQTPVADDAPNRVKGKVNSRGEPKLSGQALWATPNTMDGMQDRSLQAMQKTYTSTRKGRTAPGNLREQVKPAMWPGYPVSSAPMESSAQLNPTFVCWLMGYPIAWESCADMVTPSSRKSRRNL